MKLCYIEGNYFTNDLSKQWEMTGITFLMNINNAGELYKHQVQKIVKLAFVC